MDLGISWVDSETLPSSSQSFSNSKQASRNRWSTDGSSPTLLHWEWCKAELTLFAIFFTMKLREAKEYLQYGIYIRFSTDGCAFSLHHLLSRTKTSEEQIADLLFADNCALLVHTEEALQRIDTCFANTATAFGLTISLKKTKVMCQKDPPQHLPPTQHQHRMPPVECSGHIHLSWERHIQWCHRSKGCRKPHHQSKQLLQTPTKACLDKPGHSLCIETSNHQKCAELRDHHPNLRLRRLGSLQAASDCWNDSTRDAFAASWIYTGRSTSARAYQHQEHRKSADAEAA